VGTEATVQSALQTSIQALSEFDNTSVVVNDWTIKDASSAGSPWCIITNAQDYSIEFDVFCGKATVERYVIPATLMVNFVDWTTSYNVFRTTREALLAAFAADGSVGSGAFIERIDNGGVITEVYNPYTDRDYIHEELPIFIAQQINFTVVYQQG